MYISPLQKDAEETRETALALSAEFPDLASRLSSLTDRP